MNIPPRPEGDDREAMGLKALWDMLFDPKVSIFIDEEGAPVRFSKQADGRYRVHTNISGGGGGTIVYIKACLEDNTEAFIPIRIAGKIYALADGTGYVTPTIDPGSVPDGAKLIQ